MDELSFKFFTNHLHATTALMRFDKPQVMHVFTHRPYSTITRYTQLLQLLQLLIFLSMVPQIYCDTWGQVVLLDGTTHLDVFYMSEVRSFKRFYYISHYILNPEAIIFLLLGVL